MIATERPDTVAVRNADGVGLLRASARLGFVRVIVLATLIPAAWFGIIPVSQSSALSVVLVLGAYAILLTSGTRGLAVLRRADVVVVLDFVMVTATVSVSGTLSSPFLPLFYLVVLEAAATLDLRQALAASVATTGLMVLLWIRKGQGDILATLGFRLGAFVAGSFFLALFLGTLLQESRAVREREAWARALDARLRDATGQLNNQLEELRFYADLAARLSGELQSDRVHSILLDAFRDTLGVSTGMVYAVRDDGTLARSVAHGIAAAPNERTLPGPLPLKRGAGELITEVDETGRDIVRLALVHAGHTRAWLWAVADTIPPITDSVRRRLRGVADQGAPAVAAATLYEQVSHLANTDALTGLPNRRALLDRLATEIAACRRDGARLSVALVDLDGFKLVNDVYGHAVGDVVLIRIAKALSNTIRASDVAARFGGDEFVLLFPRTDAQTLDSVGHRLNAMEISIPGREGTERGLSVSWGTATWPHDAETLEGLLQVADHRLYAMKQDRRTNPASERRWTPQSVS